LRKPVLNAPHVEKEPATFPRDLAGGRIREVGTYRVTPSPLSEGSRMSRAIPYNYDPGNRRARKEV